ncbi:MAG TPA: sugar ABC transporter permease [Candidatus Borkfalkia avistercoris]|uniref:Sugar ABC transporter permease n=1 Tax=Candidatus Borkfalkia avistercoris TaxID=2838504 RepID=A0A9D2CYY1_9FIRM|nr:sugar ABC transporter permease [Candidatus Borkfalkia avistercoris]
MENNNVSAAAAAEEVSAVAVEAAPRRKRINRAKLAENLWGWAFVALLVIGTTVFVYVSLILSIMLSFTNYGANSLGSTFWEALTETHSQGWYYWYKYMFTTQNLVAGVQGEAQYVWSTMGATVFYLIGIPIGMILSLVLSVLMTRDIKGTGAFRVIYYIPTVASTVSVALMWRNLFGNDGFISEGLGVKFITGATYWMQRWCVIILTVWKGLGGTIVLFVAGLNGVNASYHEAADIDGANAWQIFWRITMPQLYPTIFYVLVTSVIGGMQIFLEPNLIFGDYPVASGGSSAGNRYNIPFVGYIFGVFNNRNEWAHASALGVVLAIIIFFLTLIQFALDAKKEKV